MRALDFIRRISATKISSRERAVAVLWFHGTQNDNAGLSVKEVCKQIEQAGCGKQNVTYIKQFLRRDSRIIKGADNTYQLRPEATAGIDKQYSSLLTVKPLIKCDSILPTGLFVNAKGYTKKVVNQLNASYMYSLFDCCAVMCRRLLETLIIETYEAQNRGSEIKDHDGHYLMFSGLSEYILKDTIIHLGRNTVKGLKDFKSLGDLSAHNRRFNARKSDIDKIKGNLRIACEELLHLAGQGP